MMRILLLLVLLAFVGGASAMDYYVATWGDNAHDGNVTHPWQNLTYADGQLTAGDTLHLFDGTWVDELFVFANSGNATHRITVTAYNGTPTMDCTNPASSSNKAFTTSDKDYINISDIKITDYYRVIQSERSAHIHLDNLTVIYTGEQTIYFGQDVTYSSIKNSDLSGCQWNTIFIGAGVAGGCSHIVIDNNKIHNNYAHSLIDIYATDYILDNLTVSNNHFYDTDHAAIYTHGSAWGYGGQDWTIENNIGHDFTSNVIEIELKTGSIKNNTFYNITSPYAWTAYTIALTDGSEDVTMEANNISDSEDTEYKIYDGNHTIVDVVGKTSTIGASAGSSVEIEFSDGKVFSENGGQNVYWYPSKSNYTCASEGITVTTYNMTLKPTSNLLKGVVINHESNVSDDRTNITVNSSVSNNPSWINATMQNASANYSISIDGSTVDHVDADSNGIVRYQYTSSWSPHYFEFGWVSSAPFSPDHSKPYYNATHPIFNTVNSTGYIRYNRTVTANDVSLSSIGLVVTIT